MQQTISKLPGLITSLVFAWLLPANAGAVPLEFSGVLACDLGYFEMCESGKQRCHRGEVVDLAGKQTLLFDLENNTVALYEGEALVDKEGISSLSIVNAVLYLHGTNPDSKRSINGAGWMVRIDKGSGELLVASLSNARGDLMFGSCHNQ